MASTIRINAFGVRFIGAVTVGLWTGLARAQQAPQGRNESQTPLMGQIAISGNTIFVGDPYGDAQHAGGVCVYQRVAGLWSQAERIEPDPQTPSICFGRAVATAGDELFVGAPGIRHGNEFALESSGSIFIYRHTDAGWMLTSTIDAGPDLRVPGLAGEILTDGETLVARCDPPFGYFATVPFVVFHRSADQWQRSDLPMTENEHPHLAIKWPVAIDAGTLIASNAEDRRASSPTPPSVSVYEQAGIGWRRSAHLIRSGPALFGFGESLAIEGSTIMVADPNATVDGKRVGAVYAYERREGVWVLADTLIPPADDRANMRFGGLVAFSGNIAVVTSAARTGDAREPALHVFRRSGSTWTRSTVLTSADLGSRQRLLSSGAKQVVVRDGVIAVPIHETASDGASVPQIAVFEQVAGEWKQVATLTQIEPHPND